MKAIQGRHVLSLLMLMVSVLTPVLHAEQTTGEGWIWWEAESTSATNWPEGAGAEDWLQFRGPNRMNVTEESVHAEQWPDGGPPLLWSAPVGRGNGTVVVKDGRGYVLGGLPLPGETDSRRKGREVLNCLDIKTGAILWQRDVHPEYSVSYGSPHTTPSIDAERIYVHSEIGHLVCYAAGDGEELWRRDPTEDLTTGVKKYGVTNSPLVRGDRVYIIAVGRDPESEKAMPIGGKGVGVYAFDAHTGEDVWQRRFDIPGQTPHSAAVWGVVDGRETVLCHLSEAVVGLEPATGEVLWTLDYMEAFPECKGGRVYSSESWPLVMENGLIIDRIWNDVPSKECKSRAAGSLGRVVAFRVKDGKATIEWTNEDVSPYYLGLQPREGYLYGLNNKHVSQGYQWAKDKLVCLEIATGKVMWETQDWPIPGINEGVKGWQKTADPAMTIAGGALVIADKRELVVMDCNPRRPERLAAFRVDLIHWSMPVVANGRLYLRQPGEPGRLLCYDVSTGESEVAE